MSGPTEEGYSKWQTKLRHLAIIDQEIRAGLYPSRDDLGRKLEVSRRSVQRVIDFLRDERNAPIEYDRKKRGYYYTEPTWQLPLIQMGEGELIAIMLSQKVMQNYSDTPWANKLSTALDRIAATMPKRIEVNVDQLSRTEFSPWPAANIQPGILDSLLQAIRENKTVVMSYYSMNSGKQKDYRINPYMLRCHCGGWYLAGHVQGDDEKQVKLFNVARINKLSVTKVEFDYSLAEFNPDEYFGQKFGTWHAGKKRKVKLEFIGPAAMLVKEQIWSDNQKLTRKKNGNSILEMEVASIDEILHWVLWWGSECKVISPKPLKDAVRDMITEMYKMQKE